jgi:hypothetical protein
MRPLAETEILECWERGTRLASLDRILLVLNAAAAAGSDEDVADWPLGRRNSAIAQWRGMTFGRRLEAWAQCERCGDRLEFELDTLALVGTESPPGIVDSGRLRFRAPTSRDLAMAAAGNPVQAARRLLELCRLDSEEPPTLSESEVEGLGDRLAEADPLAEIRVDLRCPSCDHGWDEDLDLGALVWVELDAMARRLLLDVHQLATAYGWSEAEILELSPLRRSVYLEAAQS